MTLTAIQPVQRISLKGLARLSGYSYFTVSKVMNDHAGVSDKARRRILEIAQEVNYRPNAAARSIYRDKTLHVGVMIRNAWDKPFHNPGALEMIVGLNNALACRGYLLSLIRIGDVVDDLGHDSRAFREHALDGLVISGGVSREVIQAAQTRIPCCLYMDCDAWQSHGCIQRDEYDAGYALVKHLVAQGYQQLVWVGPCLEDGGHYSWIRRFAGAHDAASESAVQWHSFFRPHGPASPTHHMVPDEMVRRFSQPDTAVVCYGVGDAMEWAMLAMSFGLMVGRDYGIASCEDMQLFAEHWPDLTRVRFNRLAMGQQAAEMFLQLLSTPNDPPLSRMFRSELVVGRTTHDRSCVSSFGHEVTKQGEAKSANPGKNAIGATGRGMESVACETDMLCVCGK